MERLRRDKKIESGADADANSDQDTEKVVMDNVVSEVRQGGAKSVEVEDTGHHTQNDVQGKEGAEALRRFAEQA
jgi:hypothetical protein